jgi:DNA-binding NarL/FixJ family response regulator
VTTRIFVVEDHAVMREMLETYLGTQPDFSICGSAPTGEEAIARIGDSGADVVVIDVSLPGISGLDVLKAMLEGRSDLCCVMNSGHGQSTYIDQALAAGARGYVLKGRPAELPEAIRSALRGESYVSPSLRARQGSG